MNPQALLSLVDISFLAFSLSFSSLLAVQTLQMPPRPTLPTRVLTEVASGGSLLPALLHPAGALRTFTPVWSPLHIGRHPPSAQRGSIMFSSHPPRFLKRAPRQWLVSRLEVSVTKRPLRLELLYSGLHVKRSERRAEARKDTVGPREQHRPSYHLPKDAADWPHVHWDQTHTHTHTRFINDSSSY